MRAGRKMDGTASGAIQELRAQFGGQLRHARIKKAPDDSGAFVGEEGINTVTRQRSRRAPGLYETTPPDPVPSDVLSTYMPGRRWNSLSTAPSSAQADPLVLTRAAPCGRTARCGRWPIVFGQSPWRSSSADNLRRWGQRHRRGHTRPSPPATAGTQIPSS